MQLIPIENVYSNRDSVRKARAEAFLISKGRTFLPHGLNIREEIYYFFIIISFALSFIQSIDLILRSSVIAQVLVTISTCPNVNSHCTWRRLVWPAEILYTLNRNSTLYRSLLLLSSLFLSRDFCDRRFSFFISVPLGVRWRRKHPWNATWRDLNSVTLFSLEHHFPLED